jgi:hypothetical protein
VQKSRIPPQASALERTRPTALASETQELDQAKLEKARRTTDGRAQNPEQGERGSEHTARGGEVARNHFSEAVGFENEAYGICDAVPMDDEVDFFRARRGHEIGALEQADPSELR